MIFHHNNPNIFIIIVWHQFCVINNTTLIRSSLEILHIIIMIHNGHENDLPICSIQNIWHTEVKHTVKAIEIIIYECHIRSFLFNLIGDEEMKWCKLCKIRNRDVSLIGLKICFLFFFFSINAAHRRTWYS